MTAVLWLLLTVLTLATLLAVGMRRGAAQLRKAQEQARADAIRDHLQLTADLGVLWCGRCHSQIFDVVEHDRLNHPGEGWAS